MRDSVKRPEAKPKRSVGNIFLWIGGISSIIVGFGFIESGQFLGVLTGLLLGLLLLPPAWSLLKEHGPTWLDRRMRIVVGIVLFALMIGFASSADQEQIQQAPNAVEVNEQRQEVERFETVEETEVITYETQRVETANLPRGEEQVQQAGEAGERTLTYRVSYTGEEEANRELVSDEVTKEPQDQIVMVGTYVAPAPAPQTHAPQTPSGGRTGAVCNSGRVSSATGRGACSHHGGVARWLY